MTNLKQYIFGNQNQNKIPSLILERLVLRPFSQKDAKRVQLLAGDENIASGAINLPYPYIDGIAESWINTHENEFINGNSMILAITLKDNGTLIGSLGIYLNKKHDHAELGYWVGKDYWGNGYCSEAVKGIVNYAFDTIKLNKIFAYFLHRNPASGKVLTKNGFKSEGFLKQHVKYNNKYEDIECYSLLRTQHLVDFY